MFKIGDFSRLTSVSIKTLRYYDELGLLKPAEIDRFTGYRYYTSNQLPRLHRIIALKDMGMSLEEIARLLQDDVSIGHILDLLYAKQDVIRQRLENELEHLKRVEDWISEVEKENRLPDYEIIIKKIPPVRVVSVRTMIPNVLDVQLMWRKASTVLTGLLEYTARSNAQITGPAIGMFHGETAGVNEYDWEVALPVSQELPSTDTYRYRELPGFEQMVTTVHKGGANSGAPANIALARWFESNDYRIIGSRREIYLVDYSFVSSERAVRFSDTESRTPPDTFVVEIQIPVEKNQPSE